MAPSYAIRRRTKCQQGRSRQTGDVLNPMRRAVGGHSSLREAESPISPPQVPPGEWTHRTAACHRARLFPWQVGHVNCRMSVAATGRHVWCVGRTSRVTGAMDGRKLLGSHESVSASSTLHRSPGQAPAFATCRPVLTAATAPNTLGKTGDRSAMVGSSSMFAQPGNRSSPVTEC